MKTYSITISCGESVTVYAKRGLAKEVATAVADELKNRVTGVTVDVVEDKPIEMDELDEYMETVARMELSEEFVRVY